MTVVLKTFGEILYRSEQDTRTAPLPNALTHPLHATKLERTWEKVERLNASAFLNRVQARADLNREEAQAAARGVLSVLNEAVGGTVSLDIGDNLPRSYAKVFLLVEHPDSPAMGQSAFHSEVVLERPCGPRALEALEPKSS